MVENTKKLLLSLLSVPILVLSQVIALGVGNVMVMVGIPTAAGNVAAGIIYAVTALSGLVFLCEKGLLISPKECGISRPSLKPVWGVSAFLMPLSVILILNFAPGMPSGTWISSWRGTSMPPASIVAVLTGAVCFLGFAAGIVEEAVFRGIIMTALERKWNKIVAILLPSMLFGLLHIIGNNLDLFSILQLFVAGTFVGILFSLVTYESGNIWCSSFLHAVWNIFMGSGILNIGTEVDSYSLFNYVIDSNSFLISGGDFGIDASIVSVFIYILFSAFAFILCKKMQSIHKYFYVK